MQDQVIEGKVLDALRDLAGTIGQTAETLWPMAVQATWAKGMTCLVMAILAAVVLPMAMRRVLTYAKTMKDREDAWLVTVFTFIFGVIGITVGVCVGVVEGLPSVIAPEGITLLEILR